MFKALSALCATLALVLTSLVFAAPASAGELRTEAGGVLTWDDSQLVNGSGRLGQTGPYVDFRYTNGSSGTGRYCNTSIYMTSADGQLLGSKVFGFIEDGGTFTEAIKWYTNWDNATISIEESYPCRSSVARVTVMSAPSATPEPTPTPSAGEAAKNKKKNTIVCVNKKTFEVKTFKKNKETKKKKKGKCPKGWAKAKKAS